MTPHDHDDQLATAAAWVLGALPDDEARRYVVHLEQCAQCRSEVARLQPVADVMPLAAPSAEPSPDLKRRIMAEVEREAELLAAAGAGADQPPVAPRPKRRRARWWAVRPGWVAAGAAAVLAVGVAVGLIASSGEEAPGTLSASVTEMAGDRAAHGELVQRGSHAELVLDDMPAPPAGRVYQVWIVRDGRPAPDAVFTVDRGGDGSVVLKGDVSGAEAVLITAEPEGGSRTPTSDPMMGATPS